MTRTADRTLRGRLYTAVLDIRYGALLRGNLPSKFSHLGAVRTANTPYHILPTLFTGLVDDNDVLVDVGCGKGRVINWWLSKYPKQRIYGIELDPDVAAKTAIRLRRYTNVTILAGDACRLLPADGTVFFLFNPFDENVMRRFITALTTLPETQAPRRIIYYFCRFKELFAQDSRFRVIDVPVPIGFHASAVIELCR
jgi:hypothetical protein